MFLDISCEPNIYDIFVLIIIRTKDEVGTIKLVEAFQLFLLPVARLCFVCGSLLLILFCVCHAFLSVHCSLVVICWESIGLFALFCLVFSCGFVTFPCGVLGQVWHLTVST